MHRRSSARRAFALPLLLLPALLEAAPGRRSAEPQRPDIVIILVDDMGFSDIGCYGGEIETPHLDRLASRGLRFTQFYNAGRCCPTRASLLTGLHPHEAGIGHMTEPPDEPLGFAGPYQGFLNERCRTIAQVLRSADYHTLMSGKWHLGYHRRDTWPLQRGFDRYYGGISGAFNYFKPGGRRGMTYGNAAALTGDDFYATDTLTDAACHFVSQAAAKDDRPFFLYLAYNAPHWPLNAKWKDYEKYRGKYRDGWKPLMARRLAKQKELGLFSEDLEPASHVGPEWESLPAKQRDELDVRMAAYAACIDSIDQNIGRLVGHLERLGKLENTVIFFLSDNGSCQEGGRLGRGGEDWVKNPPLETVDGIRLGLAWANASNTPFRLYKHFVHEGGACTPLVVHWPAGIPEERRGSFVRQYAYLPDFMATCLALSGAEYPKSAPALAGKSMLPLLEGSREAIHPEPIFFEHEGNAALRHGKWKLVREYKKPWELYDLDADRCELRDLSATESVRRERMISEWEAWAKKTRVAYPERFNMYEFLGKKRRARREAAKKAANQPD